MRIKRFASYVAVFAVAFILGTSFRPDVSTNIPQTVENHEVKTGVAQSLAMYDYAQFGTAQLVVRADYPNPNRIDFIATEPIAPDFFVGHGSVGRGYAVFLDDPEKWDPLGVGIDGALSLIDRIRNEVPGVTEDIYAQGYTLSVTIADSHLLRKSDIIEEIVEIIQETYEASATV